MDEVTPHWTAILSAARLAADLEELSRFGRAPSGAMTRLALGADDAAARSWVAARMRALRMTVAHDVVGNLYGRRDGSEAGAAPVLTGSHLDSVPEGGRYDGPLGVLGPLEAVRAWNEAGVVTRRPVEVVVFVGEEGSRFGRGTLGSSALAGDLRVADILALRDPDGVSFADALATYGDAAADARPCPVARDAYAAFVELHVEQGGVLESRRLAVGNVEAICGLVQKTVTFDGEANHAGATPMPLRRDALAAAALVIGMMVDAPERIGAGTVATVGRLAVEPGAFNIVPGRATLGLDMRGPTAKGLDALSAALDEAVAAAAARHKVETRIELRQRVEPGPMAAHVIAAIDRAAKAASLGCLTMPSGAIHDALHVSHAAPAGMVFVPSVGGRSHCPDELSSPEAMIKGVDVLGRALLDLAT